MKRILLTFGLLIALMAANAQQLTVKSVSLRQSDLKASTVQRKDASGKPCAIVRVGIVGVKDMQFEDAVGEVDYSLGEYIVYVPEGLKALKYSTTSGKVAGKVIFDDYDLEVETKRVYSVVMESENHMRAAIFSIHPATARLTVNGQPVVLDKDGMAVLEKPVGSYEYQVEANGYISQSGVIKLTENEISSTANLQLEQKQYALRLVCNPADATLFIDNNPYGKLSEQTDLKLPDGEHNIRLTAVGYNDYEQTITVDGQALALNVAMVKMKEQIVEHKEERTRTHVNLRPAYYTIIGGELYDKDQYLGHDWGLRFSLAAMQHFGVIFSVYEGLAGGIMNLTKNGRNKWFEHPADSANTWFIEIPLLVGVSVPFGKYNKHMFSILGGGYGKVMLTEIVSEKSTKAANEHGNDYKTNWDYGFRGMAILDISHFTIAAEVGLSLAKYDKINSGTAVTTTTKKETNKPNLFFGVSLGAKL